LTWRTAELERRVTRSSRHGAEAIVMVRGGRTIDAEPCRPLMNTTSRSRRKKTIIVGHGLPDRRAQMRALGRCRRHRFCTKAERVRALRGGESVQLLPMAMMPLEAMPEDCAGCARSRAHGHREGLRETPWMTLRHLGRSGGRCGRAGRSDCGSPRQKVDSVIRGGSGHMGGGMLTKSPGSPAPPIAQVQ